MRLQRYSPSLSTDSQSLFNQLRARVQDIVRNCDPPIHVVVEPVGEVIVVRVRESATKPVQCSGLAAVARDQRAPQ